MALSITDPFLTVRLFIGVMSIIGAGENGFIQLKGISMMVKNPDCVGKLRVNSDQLGLGNGKNQAMAC
jgi:hypothetical protein